MPEENGADKLPDVGPSRHGPAGDSDHTLSLEGGGWPLVGQLYAGRYEVEEEIGRGGFGIVYRTFDRGPLKRQVALKILHREAPVAPGESQQDRKRFLHEAQLAASLSHASVATIYDAGEWEGVLYMTQELAPGRDLRRILAEGGTLDLRRTLTIVRQICEGLTHAHARGIVHRDIKPSNILVDEQDGVKITDFGLAQSGDLDRGASSARIAGTPGYMAPEQILGERVDARADLFSVGCMLYHMLTGRAPFEGETPHSVMEKTLNLQPTAPSRVRGDLPRSLDRIVSRALRKNREERYGTVSSFLQELLNYEQFDYLADRNEAAAAAAEALERRDCIVFLGLRLPVDSSGGVTGTGEDLLARFFEEKIGDSPERDSASQGRSLHGMAQMLETVRGRSELIRLLGAAVRLPGLSPREVMRRLARLPFPLVITTRYDSFLEEELARNHRSVRRIVPQEEFPEAVDSEDLLVHLFGTCEEERSLVVTEEDLWQFFGSFHLLADVLKSAFATKTLVFVGYDPDDPNFRHLFLEIVKFRAGRPGGCFMPTVHNTLPAVVWAERKGLALVECEPGQFLGLVEEALVEKRRASSAPDAKPAPSLPKRPYKFLNHFESDDEVIFFGRKGETQRFLSKIHAYPLNLLYAASGCGKTSLIEAGLMPELRRSGYCPAYARVFEDPFGEIVRAVAEVTDPLPGSSETGTAERSITRSAVDRPLEEVLMESAARIGRPLVVFLDQFEELFIRYDHAVRDRFAASLQKILAHGKGEVRFVLCLREDFLPRLSEFRERIPAIFHNEFRLERLGEEASRAAIVEPARLLGLEVERELVEQLIADLTSEGVDPPQLQIVCDTLYDAIPSGETRLTKPSYEKLGGTRGILTGYLEKTLRELPAGEREATRELLKALVTSEATKTVTGLSGLARILGRLDDEIERILRELVERRLVRRIQRQDGFWYELSHEYLVQEIGRWLSEKDRQLKKVRELLDQALRNHRHLGLLMPAQQICIVRESEDDLKLDKEERQLLRLSEQALQRRKKATVFVAAAAVILLALIGLCGRYVYLSSHYFVESVDRELLDTGWGQDRGLRFENLRQYRGAPGRLGIDRILGFPKFVRESDLSLNQLDPKWRDAIKRGQFFKGPGAIEEKLLGQMKPTERVKFLVFAGRKEEALGLVPPLFEGPPQEDQALNDLTSFLATSGVDDPRFVDPALRYVLFGNSRTSYSAGRTGLTQTLTNLRSVRARPAILASLLDRRARKSALIVLGGVGERDDDRYIFPHLKDSDPEVRGQAVMALSLLGSVLARDALLNAGRDEQAFDDDISRGWALVECLERNGIGEAWPEVERLVRQGAVSGYPLSRILGLMVRENPARAIPLTRELFASKRTNPQTARACVEGLGEGRSPAAVSILEEALSSPYPEVAAAAANALSSQGRPDGIPVTLRVLRDSLVGGYEASAAVHALSAVKGLEVRRFLIQILKAKPQKPPEIRSAAMGALKWYEDEEVLSTLAAGLGDANSFVRDAALTALTWEGSSPVIELLRKTKREGSLVQVIYAARGLQRLGQLEDEDFFLRILQDQGDTLRDYRATRQAILGLRDAGLEQAPAEVGRLLGHRLHSVRMAAILAMIEHPQSEVARSELERLSQDQDPDLRIAARRCLEASMRYRRAMALGEAAGQAAAGGNTTWAEVLLRRADLARERWGKTDILFGYSEQYQDLTVSAQCLDSAWVALDLRRGRMDDVTRSLGILIHSHPHLRSSAAQDPRFEQLRQDYQFRILTGLQEPVLVPETDAPISETEDPHAAAGR